MNNPRPPTLLDVARAVGVSSATVSRYRRGVRRFEPGLAARIDRAIADLGYQDNLAARSLATGRCGAVGLVVMDLTNPHFTNLVAGAHRVALDHGVSLLFVDTAESPDPEQQLVETLARRVDGLVVSARLAGGSVDWLLRLGKPVVFFGASGLAGWHSVSTDGAAAAALLGAHLAALGHREVVYLDFAGSRWSAERQRGLRQPLAAAGGNLQVHPVAAPSAEAGEAVAASILFGNTRPRPTAVVAYNDLIAIGFMAEAMRLGVPVPQQLSVAGFDDIELARHVRPALTTVSMNSGEQGAVGMQRLLQLIDGQLPEPGDERLPPRLQRRGSTAEPVVAHGPSPNTPPAA